MSLAGHPEVTAVAKLRRGREIGPWSKDMIAGADPMALLQGINGRAEFNRWCGIEVTQAGQGSAEIAMPWRQEAGQYSDFLHAGLVSALIDTACGFAPARRPTRSGGTLLGKLPSSRCWHSVRRKGKGRQSRQSPGIHLLRTVCRRRIGRETCRNRRNASYGREEHET